jgi:hypothetical protein
MLHTYVEEKHARVRSRQGRDYAQTRNRNSKSQISNIKQITITEIPNSKPVLVIEYWDLRFVCNLVLGI